MTMVLADQQIAPAEPLHRESLDNALTASSIGCRSLQQHVPGLYRGGLPGRRLKRVTDYIATNLAQDLSLARLAGVAGMSPHYFAELFKQSTGIPPHRYVLLQRIEWAKRQLRDPGFSVIDAALDAGFNNPSHFARMFRKFVGTSPSNFRVDLLSRLQFDDLPHPGRH
jgi:AraC family transcriptional regulator